MRQGSNNQNNRRGRGRGHHHHNKRNNHHGNRNQNYDSNGPNGRIRGTAKQVYDKYLQLAKDAISSGDRVLAESFFQHADHYSRIVAQFAPKPRPEEEETAEVAVPVEEASSEEADVSEKSDTVDIQIVEGDAPEATEPQEELALEPSEEAVEEKPKRRTRRSPKKAAADEPKLGGGANAVPDFLARPVDVEGGEATEQETVAEEKPKRKRVTRRKKVETEPAADDGDDAEVVTA